MLATLIVARAVRLALEDCAVTKPAYHIHYSSHWHVPTGPRLLIDLIREVRPLGL